MTAPSPETRHAEAATRARSGGVSRAIARVRVGVGFLMAGLVLWLARPTATSVLLGAGIALCGEAIRVWAAGHVEKSREVTRSGPYRFTRHPLYLGSSIIGIGIAVASGRWVVGALIVGYLGVTVSAAIRAEEAHLREKFGAEYDAYAARTAPPMRRSFSASRAIANREHHTIAGLLIGLLLLALKVGPSIR